MNKVLESNSKILSNSDHDQDIRLHHADFFKTNY